MGGNEISPKEKPLDTPEHERRRKQWISDCWNILADVLDPDIRVYCKQRLNERITSKDVRFVRLNK